MPRPKKKETKNIQSPDIETIKVSMSVPSLSGLDKEEQKKLLEEIKNNIQDSIHNSELISAIDRWQKSHDAETRIYSRDYHLLRSQILEYLDSFLLLGYDSEGQRIIVQNFNTQRDRDAVIEFLKNVFLMQQQQNFLDEDPDDEETNL